MKPPAKVSATGSDVGRGSRMSTGSLKCKKNNRPYMKRCIEFEKTGACKTMETTGACPFPHLDKRQIAAKRTQLNAERREEPVAVANRSALADCG